MGTVAGDSGERGPRFPLLVGREREQATLRRLLDSVLSGSGAMVLVGGEAGIGKTALVQAFTCEATARGALVLAGHCFDLSTTPPYGPWLDFSDRYTEDETLPGLPDALKRGTGIGDLPNQLALFEEVAAFLEQVAAAKPLVLILEDLHWSDPTSLDLLRYVGRQVENHQIMLIATYRDDELTRQHPLFTLIPVLVRESSAERIDLRRLRHQDVRSMIDERYKLPAPDAARLVSYLQSRAEGNPLFLHEVLRTLEGEKHLYQTQSGWRISDLRKVPVPSLIRQVIEGRLMVLDESTQEMLRVASVIGEVVPFDQWEAVSDTGENRFGVAVEEAIDANVLVETSEPASLRFAHSLVQETLYESVLLPRRRQWHRRTAEALVASPRSDPDVVAYHFSQAGDPRAAEWLIRAGERAQQAYAWRTAAEHFDHAARLLEGDADQAALRGWLLYRSAGSLLRSDPQAGILRYDHALDIARAIDDRRLAALALTSRGLFKCFVGDVRVGIAEMQEGADAWDALSQDQSIDEGSSPYGSAPSVAYSALTLAARGTVVMWLSVVGRYRESLEMGERYLARFRRADGSLQEQPSPEWIDAYDGLATALAALGDPKRSMEMFEAALDAYRFTHNSIMESNVLRGMLECIVVPYQTERVTERRQLAARAGEILNRAIGALPPGTDPRIQMVQTLKLEGDWDDLRDLAARGREWHSNIGRHLELMSHLAYVARHQWESDLAWKQIEDGFPDGPQTEPGNCFFHFAIELLPIAAELSLDAGEVDFARDWIEAYDRWIDWSGAVLGQAEGKLLWGRYHLALRYHSAARECA
jgi:tetratricopeptide (TPR) repeat protein